MLSVSGDFVVAGTKSSAAKIEGTDRLFYAEEATEVWFTDYGFGTLRGNSTAINIDPLFAQTVNLSEPYHITVMQSAGTQKDVEFSLWAVERVSPTQSLTIYMVSHGIREEFYLDKVQDQILTPSLLDEWLTELETIVPGIKSNIILEACHSGSFINSSDSISGENRVVIASASANNDAYTSNIGAYFTDSLRVKLGKNFNLAEGFEAATTVVHALFPSQDPWLDADGDGRPNEDEDKVLAATRSFQYDGSLQDNLPPFIVEANAPSIIVDRRGTIQAEVRDNDSVEFVWAIVYPPDYVPPAADGELNVEVQDLIVLQRTDGNQKGGTYTGDYLGFSKPGTYRLVVQARDKDGLNAQPVVLEVEIAPPPTDTPIPPTETPTDTPTPTATLTDTPVPPTDTPVPTSTSVPPTQTPTPTDTLVPLTPTAIPIPTATRRAPVDTVPPEHVIHLPIIVR